MPPLQIRWPTGSGPVSYRARAQPYASEEPRSLCYDLRNDIRHKQWARSAISFAVDWIEVAADSYNNAGCHRTTSRNITLRLTGPRTEHWRNDAKLACAAPVQPFVG